MDLGSIDGDAFVNTASLGVYVALVEARGRLERIIGRWPSGPVVLIRILRTTESVHLEVDGETIDAWLVFFGNCRFLPEGLAPSTRPQLEDGRLDVRMVQASHPFPPAPADGGSADRSPANFVDVSGEADRPTCSGPDPPGTHASRPGR